MYRYMFLQDVCSTESNNEKLKLIIINQHNLTFTSSRVNQRTEGRNGNRNSTSDQNMTDENKNEKRLNTVKTNIILLLCYKTYFYLFYSENK